jgi:hypothetical protein
MIVSIKAKVIDSCIEVIIGRPVIRFHNLTRKIPSYFDELSRAAKAIRKLGPCLHLYVELATHVHTPDVSSHMRNRWGLMLARIPYG